MTKYRLFAGVLCCFACAGDRHASDARVQENTDSDGADAAVTPREAGRGDAAAEADAAARADDAVARADLAREAVAMDVAAAASTDATPVVKERDLAHAPHPFLYCGELVRDISIVENGAVKWSYTTAATDEVSDCTRLSSGNIVFAARAYAAEVNPDKKVVWNYPAPAGTEIHSAQPIGPDRVLLMQNGAPAKLLLVNKTGNKIEMEHVMQTGSSSVHGQFRRARMTRAGTYLVPHLDMNKVVEYDRDWNVILSVAAPSPWAAVRLKSGNTLISGDTRGYVREVNGKGETVWEIANDLPGITFQHVQDLMRLTNGNTLMCNWNGPVQVVEVTPAKQVVWVLQDGKSLGTATTVQVLDEPGVPENGDLQR